MASYKLIFLFSVAVLILSIFIGFKDLSEPTYHLKDINSEQHEIINDSPTPINILTKEGKLSVIGWSKHQENFHFTPNRINPSTSYLSILNKFRYKKWEAFVIHHKDFMIGTAVFDMSYLGGYMFHYADMTDKSNNDVYAIEQLDLFNKPTISDECNSNCLSAQYKRSDLQYVQRKGAHVGNQYLNMTLVSKDVNITLDLTLNAKDYESMVTLTPISEDSTLFYWNTKTYTIKAKGKIIVNGKTFNADDLLLAYDSGKGVWPIRSGWLWVSANGKTKNGENIGLNLGEGFSHPKASRSTEDCFFINGKIFKLNAIESKQVNQNEVMSEWTHISQPSKELKNYCNVKFTPEKRAKDAVSIPLLPFKFSVKYGVYSGTCVDDQGKIYEFKINGIFEEKTSIW